MSMPDSDPLQRIIIDPDNVQAATRDGVAADVPKGLPTPKASNTHPSNPGGENGSVYFVGTATTIIEWNGVRIMTDPNFLHAGDHVHLGPGVYSKRKTNPAVDLHELPRIDVVLLSHYHADHFDQLVEDSLRRDLPIISTPHAKSALGSKEDPFTDLYELDTWHRMMVNLKSDLPGPEKPGFRITAMPGKHVPDIRPLEMINDFLGAVPPTNGYILEMGYGEDPRTFKVCYRIYITGDTLMYDQLDIISRISLGNIDLMLIHLGGTTVPGPWMNPLTVMLTMDAKQGTELVQLMKPRLTIPIHYDDYDVFASPLEDFKKEIDKAGLGGGVVYLDRGDEYRFKVRDVKDAI